MSNTEEKTQMYTAQELVWATQLAYCNFTKEVIDEYVREHNGEYPTVQQLVSEKGYTIFYNYDPDEDPTGDSKTMRDETMQFLDDVSGNNEEEEVRACQGWRIVSVKDCQDGSGMYAITIETGEDNAIVAFRGSESSNNDGLDLKQLIKDWLVADFNILNGRMTAQEKDACQYVDEVGNSFGYANFAVTGHSLGGNLALVSTVYTATDDCGSDMASRIKQSVSMDGPGHPAEFQKKYADAIGQMQGVMTHYQWSWVGAILPSLCHGDNYVNVLSTRFHEDFLAAVSENPEVELGVLLNEFMSFLLKHSTASLGYDENGEMIPAEDFDMVAGMINSLTRGVDEYNELQNYLGALIAFASDMVEDGYELAEAYGDNYEKQEEWRSSWKAIKAPALDMGLDICLIVLFSGNPLLGSALRENGMQEKLNKDMAAFGDTLKQFFSSEIALADSNSSIFLKYAETLFEYVRDTAKLAGTGTVLMADIWKNQVEKTLSSLYDNMSEIISDPQTYIGNMFSNGTYTLKGSTEDDVLFGKTGDGTIYGYDGDDVLFGGNGNDLMYGGSGKDVLYGGNGSDSLYGDDGDDILHGQDGMDFLYGGSGDDMLYGGDGNDFLYGGTGNDALYGGSGGDTLYGESGDDVLYGEEGNDFLHGGDGSDYLYGGAGNDYLYGEYGDDTLTGGAGADYMEGGNGADAYVVGAGDGNDTIRNYDTGGDKLKDRIVFGEGIRPEDIELKRWGTDLFITNTATGQVTKIQEEYGGTYYGLSRIEFADGTMWDNQTFVEKTITRGTDGNDTINGGGSITGIYSESETIYAGAGNDTVKAGSGNDTVYGGEGNDSLYGGDGDDTLVGGTGNDYLEGGNGADAYVIGAGDGNNTIHNYDTGGDKLKDRIVFGEGIRPEDIELRRWGNDLFITNTASGQVTKIQSEYGGTYYGLSRIEFADGTVWDTPTFIAKTIIRGTDGNDTINGGNSISGIYSENETIHAGDGNDTVKAGGGNDTVYGEAGNDSPYGGDGDDRLVGGTGDDYLEGGNGADAYVIDAGDGNDTIHNYDTGGDKLEDRIVFGEGIRPEDIELGRWGNDLFITNTASGQVTKIQNEYGGTYYGLSRVEFADGTEWDNQTFVDRTITRGTDGADEINGGGSISGIYSENETIYAGAGNDTVKAGGGNDTVYGEDGDDRLYGGDGDDRLVGGTGDDYLEGGNGADTYVIGAGDGNDTIHNYDSSRDKLKDRIVFGEGIRPEDIELRRWGTDLYVTNLATGQVTKIQNEYGGTYYGLSRVEFADGTVWDNQTFVEKTITRGTSGNDTITGGGSITGIYSESETIYAGAGNDTVKAGSGNDTVYGEAGDDRLYGGDGDDRLIGGAGADYLEGGNGADTYIIRAEDGNDTIHNYDTGGDKLKDRIVFREGIRPEGIELRRWGNDLFITNTASGQVTKIQSEYGGTYYGLSRIEFADGTVWDTPTFIAKTIIRGTDGNDTINGGNSISGIYSENETIHAGDGNDTVKAGGGNDTVYGEAGNDSLYGGDGDDTLVGGDGNDYLEGGNGADAYVIGAGDGNDTIHNYDTGGDKLEDRIVFGEGIRPEDIELGRWGNDLFITNTASGQVTKIQNEYGGTYYGLSRIEFADGTVWDTPTFIAKTITRGTDGADMINGGGSISGIYSENETIHAGAGNDTVKAGGGNDTVYGEAGNDSLYGDAGDDTLVGGAGDDYLDGGTGADTYVIGAGDGNDTIRNYDTGGDKLKDKIVFGKGIRPEDIELRKWGNDLFITNTASGQVTKIQEEYGGTYYGLSQVEFADGTVWDNQTFVDRTITRGTDGNDEITGGVGISGIYSESETIYAGAGNDTVKAGAGNDTVYGEEGSDRLYGGDGDDTLVGGTGDDYLEGGAGNDTYIFNRGDGKDTIADRYGTNLIVFGAGIKCEDITLSRAGNNLEIRNGVEGDSITINSAYSSNDYRINSFRFDDGITATVNYNTLQLEWEPLLEEKADIISEGVVWEEEGAGQASEEIFLEEGVCEVAGETFLKEETGEIFEETSDEALISSGTELLQEILDKEETVSDQIWITEYTDPSDGLLVRNGGSVCESPIYTATQLQLMAESMAEPAENSLSGDTSSVTEINNTTELTQLWVE